MTKRDLLSEIEKNYQSFPRIDDFHIDKGRIINLLNDLMSLFFPRHFPSEKSGEELLDDVTRNLKEEIAKVDVDYEAKTEALLEKLPIIQNRLYKDTEAIYDGDPSAKTFTEIILSFPGFLAVFAYRVAHELYDLNVPIIPRIIAEYAHEKTGIDLNPGAKIGEYFCIDHGTGIVVGETATVGDHVRMYHGVTLGVRKFNKGENGVLLKGGKRHPDVGNNVTIYANATILGGETQIADHSSISTGSLITESNNER